MTISNRSADPSHLFATKEEQIKWHKHCANEVSVHWLKHKIGISFLVKVHFPLKRNWSQCTWLRVKNSLGSLRKLQEDLYKVVHANLSLSSSIELNVSF